MNTIPELKVGQIVYDNKYKKFGIVWPRANIVQFPKYDADNRTIATFTWSNIRDLDIVAIFEATLYTCCIDFAQILDAKRYQCIWSKYVSEACKEYTKAEFRTILLQKNIIKPWEELKITDDTETDS